MPIRTAPSSHALAALEAQSNWSASVVESALVTTDTVEERVLALQQRKRALAEAALGAADAPAITREELLELLS